MKRKVITIAKPCAENWEKMTPNEKGRFCAKCKKEVVDFSKMTTGQVVDCLTNNTGKKICGLFRNNQLGKPKAKKNQFFLKGNLSSAIYLVIKKARFISIIFFGLISTSIGCEKLNKKISSKSIIQPSKKPIKEEANEPKEEPLPEIIEIKTTKGEACIEEIEVGQP